MGGANIIGTYAFGRIGDIVPKRVALAIIYLARAVIFIALIYLPLTETRVLIFAFLLGLLWLGTVPLTSGLVVTFFGPRWLSMLYGIVFLSHQIGSFCGAWLGGRFYDTYHSYDLLWWASVVVAVLAAALHLPIRERPASRLAAAAVCGIRGEDVPRSIKWSLIGGVAILCAGAAYLMAVRGPAVLLDLGTSLAGCF